jgi:hypothetical protein
MYLSVNEFFLLWDCYLARKISKYLLMEVPFRESEWRDKNKCHIQYLPMCRVQFFQIWAFASSLLILQIPFVNSVFQAVSFSGVSANFKYRFHNEIISELLCAWGGGVEGDGDWTQGLVHAMLYCWAMPAVLCTFWMAYPQESILVNIPLSSVCVCILSYMHVWLP